MTWSPAVLSLVLLIGACRTYDFHSRVTDQAGLVPADRYARYGTEEAEATAIAREYGRARSGDTPEALARQAAAAEQYARSLPDVAGVTVDTLLQRLTIQFRSGWRVAVNPLEDGKGAADTRGLPGKAAAPTR